MSISARVFSVLCIATVPLGLSLSAETITVSGKSEVPVAIVKKKEIAVANQQALAAAESAARADAIAQAVYQVYGNRARLGSRADEVIRSTVDHSAAMIIEAQVRAADVQNGKAIAELVVRIDGQAMRDYLENSLGLSITAEAEKDLKVYVLSYTVEGQDPNRADPQILKEEVTDNHQNIHASSESSAETNASAASSAASLHASHTSSNVGQAQQIASGSLHYSGAVAVAGQARHSSTDLDEHESGSAALRASASENLAARGSESSSASWDKRSARELNARSTESHASFEHNTDTRASYSDTSRSYHKLVIYADPTKKGTGATNEVRAKLGELLKASGLMTSFYDINLMGREFATEDELYHEILATLKQDPEVSPSDYVAVALNRFTPVLEGSHRYTSQVTYRVLRIHDGQLLLPDKNVTGDSGAQASDDSARTIATELALAKTDDVLEVEVVRAIRTTQRSAARETIASSTSYIIRVDNVFSPAATVSITQALRGAGFMVSPQFRGAASTETIAVTLNGKSGTDVLAVIESQVAAYDVVSMDEHGTVLRNR